MAADNDKQEQMLWALYDRALITADELRRGLRALGYDIPEGRGPADDA